MEFKGNDHIYNCVPDCLGIKEEYEMNRALIEAAEAAGRKGPEKINPIIISLKRLTRDQLDKAIIQEKDVYATFNQSEALSKIGSMVDERLKEKFAGVKNLVIDKKEIKTFAEFMELSPPELIAWARTAIYSTYALSEAEIKN